MTLLTIAKQIAVNVGIQQPSAVMSDPSADDLKIVEYTQAAAVELARRVDWSALRTTQSVVGTGSNDNFTLGASFSRLTSGLSVSVNGAPVRGSLSPDEWNSLTPIVGTPRFFRLLGNLISFYPYPTTALEVSVSSQNQNWCSAGGVIWTADDNTALVPEDLIVKGSIWRWRRQLGADFSDYMAEYEAALADFAKFDEGARMP